MDYYVIFRACSVENMIYRQLFNFAEVITMK